MMNKKTQNIIQLIKLNIAEIDPLARVILYGSRARRARQDKRSFLTSCCILPPLETFYNFAVLLLNRGYILCV
jgi:hypothetical protein